MGIERLRLPKRISLFKKKKRAKNELIFVDVATEWFFNSPFTLLNKYCNLTGLTVGYRLSLWGLDLLLLWIH